VPTTTPPEAELAALNREIEQLEAEAAVLEEQRAKRIKAARRAAWRLRYLRFARWFRSPAASIELWPLAAMLAGPMLAGILTMILVGFVADATSSLLLAFFVGATAGAGALAAVLYRPRDELLAASIPEAEAAARVADAHWKEAVQRLTEVKECLHRLIEDRRARMASGRVQRAALLQRRWKAMNATEWEDYLVEVCRTLGAAVDRRGHVDDGAELVIDFGDRRVAALAKVSRESLHSGAVQQALAVMQREGCQSCAILTNGRFTGAAQDYAAREGCTLIGREQFPDFVMGKAGL
jgi:hypothetical protein